MSARKRREPTWARLPREELLDVRISDLGLKLEMWAAVDPIVKEDAFFATNTSSLAVIDQAAATSRPDRFLGLHFAAA